MSWAPRTRQRYASLLVRMKSFHLCSCLYYTQLCNFPPLTHTHTDNQGRLADLLTKMLDDPSKVPSLPPPDIPTTSDHHTLAVELSNVIRQYGQK